LAFGPQSASPLQPLQALLPLQVCPAAQSAALQQEPLTQAPWQHFSPAPQCWSRVHSLQRLSTQVSPESQSAVAQQSPSTQAPLQQVLPLPQSAAALQPVQVPLAQIWPGAQSLASQHPAPALQSPSQQRPPGQSPSP
jgi:hypothetical protein